MCFKTVRSLKQSPMRQMFKVSRRKDVFRNNELRKDYSTSSSKKTSNVLAAKIPSRKSEHKKVKTTNYPSKIGLLQFPLSAQKDLANNCIYIYIYIYIYKYIYKYI